MKKNSRWARWPLWSLLLLDGLAVIAVAVFFFSDEVFSSRERTTRPELAVDRARHARRGVLPASVSPARPELSLVIRAGPAKMPSPGISPLPAPQSSPADADSSDSLKDEYVVTFSDGNSLAAFLAQVKKNGLETLGVIDKWNIVRVGARSEKALRDALAGMPGRWNIGRNYKVALPPPPGSPAEPVSGMPFEGRAMEWLGAGTDRASWGRGVTVAVLDVGVGDVPGLDDSRVERLDLTGEGLSGKSGHGNAVATILAGSSLDAEGVAPAARVLSLKVLRDNGSGDSFTIAQGIVEAADRGAQVINVCAGSRTDCPVLKRAVEYATAKGSVVVASAGNDGAYGVSYPAGYPEVIAVSSVDANRRHMPFANRGDEVDIAAPGLGVRSIWTGETMVDMSGTSASTPFVSGTIAALLSQDTGLKASGAAELVLKYCDDAGYPGPDGEFGNGILDVGRVTGRNEKNVIDAALADQCLRNVPENASEVPVVVSFQNRGTVSIKKAVLRITAAGRTQELYFENVAVGETVGYEVKVLRADMDLPAGASVQGVVVVLDGPDANPADNGMISRFVSAGTASR